MNDLIETTFEVKQSFTEIKKMFESDIMKPYDMGNYTNGEGFYFETPGALFSINRASYISKKGESTVYFKGNYQKLSSHPVIKKLTVTDGYPIKIWSKVFVSDPGLKKQGFRFSGSLQDYLGKVKKEGFDIDSFV